MDRVITLVLVSLHLIENSTSPCVLSLFVNQSETINDYGQDKSINTSIYLRAAFIFLRYSSSHAFVLIARMPDRISFIREIRRSDTVAVRRRNTPAAKDRRPKYGTRKIRKATPISVCQPIKYQSKAVTTVTSIVDMTRRKGHLASSTLCTSLDTRSTTRPVVYVINVCLLRRRIWGEATFKSLSNHMEPMF